MILSVQDMAYQARALAQSHPLTPLAKRLVDRDVEAQRAVQAIAEAGMWASTAMITGYCLRRVEETEAGIVPEFHEEKAPDLDALDEAAARIAADLRGGELHQSLLGDGDRTVAALDRIIASEVDKRLHHYSESIDDSTWAEVGEYLAWWVVKGYALRTAEMASGAVA